MVQDKRDDFTERCQLLLRKTKLSFKTGKMDESIFIYPTFYLTIFVVLHVLIFRLTFQTLLSYMMGSVFFVVVMNV